MSSRDRIFKPCKNCGVQITFENCVKAGENIYRRICRACRSKSVMKGYKKNPFKRNAYVCEYLRRTGKVVQYPCETCSSLCYKKYAKAFCSDKCRFMSYVNITDTCWLWIGAVNRRGYGRFCFEGNKHDMAHRVSYKLFNGSINEDLLVCHTCDNPSCVKPGHLWLGTTQQNKKDQIAKDRGGLKLKASDVIEIRRLYDCKVGSTTIAKLFGVNCSTVSSIIKRRCWKHI